MGRQPVGRLLHLARQAVAVVGGEVAPRDAGLVGDLGDFCHVLSGLQLQGMLCIMVCLVPSLAKKMAVTVKLTFQPNGLELQYAGHALLHVCRPNLDPKHHQASFSGVICDFAYAHLS